MRGKMGLNVLLLMRWEDDAVCKMVMNGVEYQSGLGIIGSSFRLYDFNV